MERIVEMLNKMVIRSPNITIKSTPLRGRGIFATSPIQLHEKIFTAIPLAYWPSTLPSSTISPSSSLCTLCYKPNQLSCDVCELGQAQISKDLKLFQKNLLLNPLSSQSKFSNLIAIIAYRICLELQFGYQNTFYLSHFFTFPLLDQDDTNSSSHQNDPNEHYKKNYLDHHQHLLIHLTHLGHEKQTQQFLTYEWYLRLVGVLNLNGIQIPHNEPHPGVALYDAISFLNHSCEPNVALAFNGIEATAIALREMSVGEELFIDYVGGEGGGGEEGIGGTKSRFDYLSYNYGIQCQQSSVAAPCSCGKYE
jgi:hypothetical protein